MPPSIKHIVCYVFVPLVLVLSACSGDDSSATKLIDVAAKQDLSQQQSFRTFLDKNYVQDMQRMPFTASYRGIETDASQWNSVAESFYIESLEINQQRLIQINNVDRSALSSSLQRSYDLYKMELERLIAKDIFRHHHFIIHQHRGAHTQAASYLISVHKISNVPDAKHYIARLKNISRWFDQIIEQLQIREEKQLFLAHWQYAKIIQASNNVISGAPFDKADDSSLWADFKRKIAALDLTEAQRESLLNKAREALLAEVKPAYLRLMDVLEKQAEKASNDDGVWKFKDGEAFYAERLRWYTTTDLSADDVHQLGLKEVARIHLQMQAIMKKVAFKGSLSQFFVYMRNENQFYYDATVEGRKTYLSDAVDVIDTMQQRLPEMFSLFPKAKLSVKRVEAFREKSAGKAFYKSPASDGSRPGIYYANLYDMAAMPKYQMQALAYHEGIPGHHMQRAIAVELDSVPEFQKYASFTAYTEGWGLYAEYLPKEMGLYQDPYSDFGRLAMELWRACRLVVDTGIHHKRWTREQGIKYLLNNTPNAVGDATKAIERYIAQPGQATAYMIGKLKILQLREKARSALGENFDIRRFHDEVLKDGPVPLFMLEQKVDMMIEAILSALQGSEISE
ncbi:MAG: DUF885 domain-containing protein [Pseudomonadales bacterium]|nr:DUF885 domain-containing protein [Pseudomonadales bacterium]